MNDHFQKVAEGFSRKAKEYDSFGPAHVNIERMRNTVYAHVNKFLQPEDNLLEINAGTGIDAAFFALRGHRVHAIDIAPGMVAAIAEKTEHYGLQGQLTYCNCSFTDLDCLIEYAPYRYVFSNFGGLNCISDLARVGRLVSQVLSPGGRFSMVIMPPFCPWDLAHLLHGDFRNATRRFHPGGTVAHVEGQHFQVHYFTPERVMRALGKNYSMLSLEGLSIFAPPADRRGFPNHHPALYKLLTQVDETLSKWTPFNHWGDFYMMTAEYQP